MSEVEAALDRRIAHFWGGRWTELWREVELAGARAGEPRAASRRKTMLDGRRPGRSSEPARAARIGGLVEAGELSRAAAAVVQNQSVRTEPGTLGLLRALYPAAPEGDHATGVLLRSAILPAVRDKIANKVAAAITSHPRRSGTGPADSRFEHWATLRDNPEGLDAAGTVLVRLLVGEAPRDAIEAHLGAVLVALPKNALRGGKHRTSFAGK